MKEYQIVTIANKRPHEHYYTFDAFFKSLGEEQIMVLGSHPGEYGGLGSKPRLLYNAITGGAFTAKYLIFCDCFDLVFAVPPETLFLKYKQFGGVPFVISGEKNCYPADLKDEYDKLKNAPPYKYLNSGMIVGEIEAILTVLESMDAKNIPNDYWDGEKMVNPNDQEYYQKEYLKQPVKMLLDTEQILCNTLHSVELDELDFTQTRIFNTVTKTYPCSFHLNGAAKTGPCREPILKHLNLLQYDKRRVNIR